MSGGVLIVRNNHPGPAVYTDESQGVKIPYEWAGAGDPDEADLQELPEHIGKNPNFRKAVARGMFSIEEGDDDVVDAIDRAGVKWRERQLQRQETIESTMRRETQNDMIVQACVGPGPKGSDCGQAVILGRAAKTDARPPLCAAHTHLINNYALEETDEMKDGKSVKRWIRADKGVRNSI